MTTTMNLSRTDLAVETAEALPTGRDMFAPGTGVTGIFGILLHLHMPLQYIIMMAISFGVSFAVTWLIWSPEEVKA